MNFFGLIGNPLGHSFSKKYFSEKFEREGLHDCRFELFPLETIDEFPLLIEKEKELKGIAVTIPYKESIMPLLDVIDEAASETGAVNCIKIAAGRLTGYNTDIVGFERSLVPLLKPYHKNALILGSGGSSRAVQYVLKKIGIDFTIVSRAGTPGSIQYSDVDQKMMGDHLLVINCTPVGMFPHVEEKPAIPYQFLTANHLLFDLVYNPAETAFLGEGMKHGAMIKNGYEMLTIQAEENWKIWSA